MSKRIIGFDEATYNYYLTKEQSVFEKYGQLLLLATKALGDADLIQDKKKFLEDPYEYTVQAFWDEHCKHESSHLDKETVFKSKTEVSKREVEILRKEIKKDMIDMRQYAPALLLTGLSSTLKKESFNQYLNPEKKNEYDAVLKFMEAAKALKENFKAGGFMSLLRYHESITLEKGHPVINPNYFR